MILGPLYTFVHQQENAVNAKFHGRFLNFAPCLCFQHIFILRLKALMNTVGVLKRTHGTLSPKRSNNFSYMSYCPLNVKI